MSNDRALHAITIPTALGVHTLQIAVDDRPMRLSEIVPLAQHITNLFVETALDEERRQGRSISCGPGCAACCRNLVALSAPEAFRVADVVSELDPAEQADVFRRFESACHAAEKADMLRSMARLESSSVEQRQELAERYFAAQIDCPALMDRRCRMHPERPLVCRDLNVTSPAEECARPSVQSYRRVPTAPLLSGPLTRLVAKLTGTALTFVAMPLVLTFAEEHADLAFRTWPGSVLLSGLLEQMGLGHANPSMAPAGE